MHYLTDAARGNSKLKDLWETKLFSVCLVFIQTKVALVTIHLEIVGLFVVIADLVILGLIPSEGFRSR